MQEINFLLTVDLDNFDKLMEELGEVSERYERHEGYSIEYKIKQILNGLNINIITPPQKLAKVSLNASPNINPAAPIKAVIELIFIPKKPIKI